MNIFKNPCIACCILLFIHKIKSTYEYINTAQKQMHSTYKSIPIQNTQKSLRIMKMGALHEFKIEFAFDPRNFIDNWNIYKSKITGFYVDRSNGQQKKYPDVIFRHAQDLTRFSICTDIIDSLESLSLCNAGSFINIIDIPLFSDSNHPVYLITKTNNIYLKVHRLNIIVSDVKTAQLYLYEMYRAIYLNWINLYLIVKQCDVCCNEYNISCDCMDVLYSIHAWLWRDSYINHFINDILSLNKTLAYSLYLEYETLCCIKTIEHIRMMRSIYTVPNHSDTFKFGFKADTIRVATYCANEFLNFLYLAGRDTSGKRILSITSVEILFPLKVYGSANRSAFISQYNKILSQEIHLMNRLTKWIQNLSAMPNPVPYKYILIFDTIVDLEAVHINSALNMSVIGYAQKLKSDSEVFIELNIKQEIKVAAPEIINNQFIHSIVSKEVNEINIKSPDYKKKMSISFIETLNTTIEDCIQYLLLKFIVSMRSLNFGLEEGEKAALLFDHMRIIQEHGLTNTTVSDEFNKSAHIWWSSLGKYNKIYTRQLIGINLSFTVMQNTEEIPSVMFIYNRETTMFTKYMPNPGNSINSLNIPILNARITLL
ncbi:uncharacterized protein NEPG_01527 [Nematocida parisii ERTm1]|uniref:Uncharacterized protein n=1 Tax=Nematocida parisii (strain ERTm3) TaxID=935791 RepID=I3EDL4_NEMP3|nr:uncharacterized protein NEPG_01527 [Nematocida parisii ERTm1]EIJ87311.1 hypothetical protein NEQG_02434 [Nematocida parisii ERTm3]EIJ93955.1 hypothetical protein NEPG_01527 [Nematocida parisii ERTm1]KAI5143859.1 hypothetical protein NEPAR07_0908 [Nematocida parisii]|eukprot:XP_013059355.1 hypothetical protein NEPG_01527 [Nematocida parisii ERTm1]